MAHGDQTLVSCEGEDEFMASVKTGVWVFQSKGEEGGMHLHGNGKEKGELSFINTILIGF